MIYLGIAICAALWFFCFIYVVGVSSALFVDDPENLTPAERTITIIVGAAVCILLSILPLAVVVMLRVN